MISTRRNDKRAKSSLKRDMIENVPQEDENHAL